jgi:hypothetical protein
MSVAVVCFGTGRETVVREGCNVGRKKGGGVGCGGAHTVLNEPVSCVDVLNIGMSFDPVPGISSLLVLGELVSTSLSISEASEVSSG